MPFNTRQAVRVPLALGRFSAFGGLGAELARRGGEDIGENFHRFDVGPLRRRVRPASIRPDEYAWDAGLGQDRAVRPERLAPPRRDLPPLGDDMLPKHLDDGRMGVDLERLATQPRLQPDLKSGTVLRKIVDDFTQLRLRPRRRSRPEQSGAPARGGIRGIAGSSCAALDQRHAPSRCAAAGAWGWRAGAHSAPRARQGSARPLRSRRRRVPAASRARRAPQDHLRPDEAAMRHRDVEMAGLGDDGGVGPETPNDLLRAERCVFLVGDTGDDDIARQPVAPWPGAAATIIAATPLFMSNAPRP